MGKAADIFGRTKALVGMVHVGALPGTPRSERAVRALADQAEGEARTLIEAGFDAVIVENMHDVPYLRREVGPEIVSAMTLVTARVVEATKGRAGVQVLPGANRAAVAVAHAAGARFVRAEGFVYASVADEGLLDEADAGPLLRFRRAIGAEGVAILADIKKKHSAHTLTSDVPIAEFARAAEFFDADGVVVTGVATARPTDVDDLRAVRVATRLPVAVGSGTTPDNVRSMFEFADAVIVGAWLKVDGDWRNPADPERVSELVSAAKLARG